MAEARDRLVLGIDPAQGMSGLVLEGGESPPLMDLPALARLRGARRRRQDRDARSNCQKNKLPHGSLLPRTLPVGRRDPPDSSEKAPNYGSTVKMTCRWRAAALAKN